MDLHNSLIELGISEKESIVYTALLQIGEGSILNIANNCTIKRPTIYSAIESLLAKGLINRINVGKRIRYHAESPEKLSLLLKMKERTLQNILPQLLAMQNVPHGTKPKIRFFEGKEAVTSFYKSILAGLDEKDEIFFVTSIRDLMENFPDILHLFVDSGRKWNLKYRELVPENAASLDYVRFVKRKNPKHQTRFLPMGIDLFDIDFFFTKEILAFISVHNGIFAISIEAKHFVESFRGIFKVLWAVSTPESKK